MLEVLKQIESVKVIKKSQLKTIRGAAVPCHDLDAASTNVHCSKH